MTQFPKDELSREVILEKQLERCRNAVEEWYIKLDNISFVDMNGIESPFDIIKDILKSAQDVRDSMDVFSRNLTN